MITGMEMVSIIWQRVMLKLRVNGRMVYCMAMFKLLIKMEKNSMESILKTKKMEREEFSILIKQCLKDNSKMIYQTDMVA